MTQPICQCTGPGYCLSLGRHMSETRWTECRTKPAFCVMFHAEAAAGKYTPGAAVPSDAATEINCPHRIPQPGGTAFCELAAQLAETSPQACRVKDQGCLSCLAHVAAPTVATPSWVVAATAVSAAHRNGDQPLARRLADQHKAILAARTQSRPHKYSTPLLTIGMATYDDYDGVYFTLHAIRMYHPEIIPVTEFIVVDNHPDGPLAVHLKGLLQWFNNNGCFAARYIPMPKPVGTAAPRNRIFEEATGAVVMCMDSHVLLTPGAIRATLTFADKYPENKDLWQGPMLSDHMQVYATHMDPIWRDRMFGIWAMDENWPTRQREPFQIPMHGLGLFACRRDAWLGFNKDFRGFGGEEGYIHRKFEQAGRKTLCLPWLKWLHRFGHPHGQAYPNRTHDRVRNYLLASQELGIDPHDIRQHFLAEKAITEADWVRLCKEVFGHIPVPAAPIPELQPGELPSVARMAWNYTQARAQHWLTGSRKTTKEEYDARMAICRAPCEHARIDENKSLRCNVCGCQLEEKLTWADQQCPLPEPKWLPIVEA